MRIGLNINDNTSSGIWILRCNLNMGYFLSNPLLIGTIIYVSLPNSYDPVTI